VRQRRSQTATKIFSEDRPAAGRLSIVKIAPSALDHHRGIARATECPDKERRCVRQREDDFLRTKLHTRVFVAVFIGSLASKRSAVDSAPELNVTRNALRFRKIRPDDERELALVSGRPRPLMSTPRGHLRPDKMGRERPPSERARGHLPAVAEGVAHAPARVPPSSARRPRRHSAPPHCRCLRQRIASSVSGLQSHLSSTMPTVRVVDSSSISAA
jgi:hypothetical protein